LTTAVSDSSYKVDAAALKSLHAADAKKSMGFAKTLENEKNHDVTNAVADIYSKEGDVTYQDYFEKKLKTMSGFGKFSMLYYYANFLTRMDRSVVLSGIKTIEAQGMSSDNKHITGGAKGALKRISKWYDDHKKNLKKDASAEQDKTEKITLQEKLNDCDIIIGEAEDALNRLNAKTEPKKN